MLPPDMRLEIVAAGPELATLAFRRLRTRDANVARLTGVGQAGAVDRDLVALQIVDGREAFGASAVGFFAAKGLFVLEFVFPVLVLAEMCDMRRIHRRLLFVRRVLEALAT